MVQCNAIHIDNNRIKRFLYCRADKDKVIQGQNVGGRLKTMQNQVTLVICQSLGSVESIQINSKATQSCYQVAGINDENQLFLTTPVKIFLFSIFFKFSFFVLPETLGFAVRQKS